ncbi:MAG: hypothetical protein IPK60_15295 [Sandaracinaceae bacterium]|jgi:hypothetical protein|nr:hypothetical protein [Sandaracinaceae bacterium]
MRFLAIALVGFGLSACSARASTGGGTDGGAQDMALVDAGTIGIDRVQLDYGLPDLGIVDPCSVDGGAEVTFEPRPEFNNWYFGYGAGISFQTGAPVALHDGILMTAEGVATISDHSGHLLFYTDGQTIWNRMHVPMENGMGLLGHISATQSGVIVPVPGSDKEFFVFTIGAEENNGGAAYSVVDMDLAAGFGAVTSIKNVPMTTRTAEKLVAGRHRNNIDYWIVTHDVDSNCFRTWLATADGVDLEHPVVSCTGAFVSEAFWSTPGQMKMDRTGKLIAAAYVSLRDGAPGTVSNQGAVELYDFDDETGVVSNARVVIAGNQPYGVEFSPAGTRLYATLLPPVALYQVDLCAADPASTAHAISMPASSHNSFQSLQVGPDSRIYMTTTPAGGGLGRALSVITHPDRLDVAAGVELDSVSLDGEFSNYGLPNFIQFYARPDDIILY